LSSVETTRRGQRAGRHRNHDLCSSVFICGFPTAQPPLAVTGSEDAPFVLRGSVVRNLLVYPQETQNPRPPLRETGGLDPI